MAAEELAALIKERKEVARRSGHTVNGDDNGDDNGQEGNGETTRMKRLPLIKNSRWKAMTHGGRRKILLLFQKK